MSKQESLELSRVIDTHEKLVDAVCVKLRESWLMPEEDHKVVAEEIVRHVSSFLRELVEKAKEEKEE